MQAHTSAASRTNGDGFVPPYRRNAGCLLAGSLHKAHSHDPQELHTHYIMLFCAVCALRTASTPAGARSLYVRVTASPSNALNALSQKVQQEGLERMLKARKVRHTRHHSYLTQMHSFFSVAGVYLPLYTCTRAFLAAPATLSLLCAAPSDVRQALSPATKKRV